MAPLRAVRGVVPEFGEFRPPGDHLVESVDKHSSVDPSLQPNSLLARPTSTNAGKKGAQRLELWEEIKERGYPRRHAGVRRYAGVRGYDGVRVYVSRNLRAKPQPVGPRPLSARATTRWLLTHADALPEGDQLPTWIEAVTCAADLSSLRNSAQYFERALDAVVEGFRLPWNSGVVM